MKKEKSLCLCKDQSHVLRSFIKLFLPPTGNKRKNTGNELDYIHTTLDKLFIQHFGFNLCMNDIINAFQGLGYRFYSLKGEWDFETKDVKPSKRGSMIRGNAGYRDFDALFVYVEVKASDVRALMRLTAVLPDNTNQKKQKLNERLMEELTMFKDSIGKRNIGS